MRRTGEHADRDAAPGQRSGGLVQSRLRGADLGRVEMGQDQDTERTVRVNPHDRVPAAEVLPSARSTFVVASIGSSDARISSYGAPSDRTPCREVTNPVAR